MKGFLDIEKVYLPKSCLEQAFYVLRMAGRRQTEGVALFIGSRTDTIFLIKETYQPKYTASHIEDGLFYAIGSSEIYQLNQKLYAEKLKLFAQIHSHPSEAYHSEADDAYAVVTTVGGLSIVVPDFAKGPVSLRQCAVFRLSEENIWKELSLEGIDQLIELT